MKERPLEYGEVLCSRFLYDEVDNARFFNEKRFTEVYKARVYETLEADMKRCRDCPHSKIDIHLERNHALGKEFVEGKAFCSITKDLRSSCPVKEPDSGYLKFDSTRLDSHTYIKKDKSVLPDWILDAEKDIEATTVYSTPRGRGKSVLGEVIKGSSYDFAVVDEVEQGDEQDLNEVVEFETNRSKYDNFGSW